MTNLSIRLRLTIWYAVALLVGLGLFGLGIWWVLQSRLVAGVDDRRSPGVQGLRSAGKA